VHKFAPEARPVTDKMPANALHLGFITTLAPKARIILCRRDPRDIGLADCVASDRAEHVTRALCLARSTARLAALRPELRERLANGPVCDPVAFSRHFAGARRALRAACVKFGRLPAMGENSRFCAL